MQAHNNNFIRADQKNLVNIQQESFLMLEWLLTFCRIKFYVIKCMLIIQY